MAEERFTMSKTEVASALRLAGYADDAIDALLTELPDDPVDLEAAAPTLARHGITRERLMDRRGGSP
jgi:hypothetical protein